jgi:hypothetical protein
MRIKLIILTLIISSLAWSQGSFVRRAVNATGAKAGYAVMADTTQYFIGPCSTLDIAASGANSEFVVSGYFKTLAGGLTIFDASKAYVSRIRVWLNDSIPTVTVTDGTNTATATNSAEVRDGAKHTWIAKASDSLRLYIDGVSGSPVTMASVGAIEVDTVRVGQNAKGGASPGIVPVDTAKSSWIAGVTNVNKAMTVSDLTNGYLIVSVATYGGSSVPNIDVSWHGVQMDSIGTAHVPSNGIRMFGLKAPYEGADTVKVVFSGSVAEGTIAIASFSNVNQTTPTRTWASATGSSTTASVAVTSAAGEVVVSAVSTFSSILSTSQTMLVNGANTNTYTSCVMARAAGAASVTTSYGLNGTNAWAVGGISLKP